MFKTDQRWLVHTYNFKPKYYLGQPLWVCDKGILQQILVLCTEITENARSWQANLRKQLISYVNKI